MTEDIPRWSPEAEIGVLGSMLKDPTQIAPIFDVMDVADLYEQRARHIAQALYDLDAAGTSPDAVAVFDHLHDQGREQVEHAGGLPYLLRLMDAVWFVMEGPQYAATVRHFARLRRIRSVCIETLGTVRDAHHAASGDVLEQLEREVFQLRQRARVRLGPIAMQECVREMDRELRQRHEGTPQSPGLRLSTGLPMLDGILDLSTKLLVGIAGRPSHGKSALAKCIVLHVARELQVPCLVFSIEDPRTKFTRRMVAGVSGVSSSRIRDGGLTAEEADSVYDAQDIVHALPIWVDETPRPSMQYVRSTTRRYVAEHGVRLVVIDYLQLLRTPRAERHDIAIGMLSGAAKDMAKEMDVCLLLLSQLNRGVESRADKRPQLADLRDSGAIEQDLDVCLLMFRASQYDTAARNDRVEVIIAKQRDGTTGNRELGWHGPTTTFLDPSIPTLGSEPVAEEQHPLF